MALVKPSPLALENVAVGTSCDESTACSSASDFQFVLSRWNFFKLSADAEQCGSDRLPLETTVLDADGCFVPVAVFQASTKEDADADTQVLFLYPRDNAALAEGAAFVRQVVRAPYRDRVRTVHLEDLLSRLTDACAGTALARDVAALRSKYLLPSDLANHAG